MEEFPLLLINLKKILVDLWGFLKNFPNFLHLKAVCLLKIRLNLLGPAHTRGNQLTNPPNKAKTAPILST